MPLELQRKKKAVLVIGDLTIYSASEAYAQLLPLLRESPAPVLDLAKVSEFDSAGMQILLMARREADAAGKPLEIQAASATVRDALDLVQCDELRSLIGAA